MPQVVTDLAAGAAQGIAPTVTAGRMSHRRPPLRVSPAWFYLAPLLVLLALFTYWPLVHTAILSLMRWNLNPDMPMRFEGTANYARLLASPLFHDALGNTAIYLLASIPLKVLLPLPVAVLMWALGAKGAVYRTILFLPMLVSFVVVSVVFLWLLSPIGGLLPALAAWVGLPIGNPLAMPEPALATILLISTWKVLGFNALIYAAGLTRIDRHQIEAMRLDGAGDLTLFRHLIWPLLLPTTFFVLVSTILFSLQQVFTPIDILTGGGPSNGTTNLFYMVYQLSFRSFDVGQGAAGTVLLFGLLAAATLLKLGFLERRVHYDG